MSTPDLGERPPGGLGAHVHDMMERLNRVRCHAGHEGHDIHVAATLEGYDRAEHPWMHGGRAGDLLARLAGWWA